MAATAVVSASLKWKIQREFYERNRKWQIVIIAFILISTGVTYFVRGYAGAAITLTLGILGYLLGPRALTRVREIERGGPT